MDYSKGKIYKIQTGNILNIINLNNMNNVQPKRINR